MKGGVNTTVRDLQTLFEVGAVGGLSDGQLLDRFVARREEAVFEAIVQRHGPMVWGVCRRVLRDHHDAEDAFQATFLVLARKASSVLARERVGNWLYGVAYQTARKARAMKAKRRVREGHVPDEPEPEGVREGRLDDLLPLLDRELSRLPEKYRILIVLCELEGKTHREAAETLGWPVGTVSGRLSRARALLARRLSRPGVPLLVGSLAVLLAREAAAAGVPAALAGATVRAAIRFAAGKMAAGVVPASVVALAEGVLRTMTLTKMLTLGVSGLLLGAVLAGAGVFAQPAEGPSPDRNATKPPLMKYELRLWRDGEPTGEPIVAEATRGASVRIETTDGPLEIRPAPDREGQQGDGADGLRRKMRAQAVRDGTNDRQTVEYRNQLAMERLANAQADLRALNQQLSRTSPGGNLVAVLEAEKKDLQREIGRLEEALGSPREREPRREGVDKRTRERIEAGMGMSDGSLDQRMTEMERKLDQILRALEGSKGMTDPLAAPPRQ